MIQKLQNVLIVCLILQGIESSCFVVSSFDEMNIPLNGKSFAKLEITKEEEQPFKAVISF